MWAVLLYGLPLSIIAIANLGVQHRVWRVLTYLALGVCNAVVLLLGLLFVSVPVALHLGQTASPATVGGFDAGGFGIALLLTGVVASALLLPASRRWLAHWLPLDSSSPVHATALVFALYLSALSLGLLGSDKGLMTAVEAMDLDPTALVLGQALFLLVALGGVGLGIRRNLRQSLARLGLRPLTANDLALVAFTVAAFLALDYCTSLLWGWLWPASYSEVMHTTRQLFGRFTSPGGALLLALSAGIGEETLFRGALQPRLGPLLTALVFAVGHIQYKLSPAIVEILLVGLALGWLRRRASTTACMAVHVAYNWLDLLIMPLLP